MNSIECLGILNSKIQLEGYYLRVGEFDVSKITLFKNDKNTTGNLGQAVREYVVEDYNSETIDELRTNILNDLEELENDYRRD